MKKINLYLSMMLLALCGFATNAYAVAESEPNDVWNQADVITLGATGTGTAGLSQNQDWWRVTSAVDGKLTVNWTATNSLNIYCQIYDTLGVVQYASAYTSGSSLIEKDGLAAGTYYIKMIAFYSTEAPTYSFVPTWTTPAQLIDLEPNNTRAQAKTLPLNGSKTGHIGYVFNQVDDLEDWWKVTTNLDGKLEWTITVNNSGNNVYAQLYDNNGTTLFGGGYTSGTATYSIDGLSAGTYYIKIRNFYTTEYAPYTISNNLVLPPVINDIEPNGLYTQALTIAINDSAVGHIGYYYNNLDDTLDWYKTTTTLEGRIDIRMRVLNGGNNVYMELFEGNGTTFLTGGYTSSDGTWSKDGLAAGTYYIRVRTFYNSEFAPYKMNVNLIPAIVTIDTEPNGTRALAKTINVNDSITGHIGYSNYLLKDTFDYRKITLTQYGTLAWKLNVLNGQNVYAELFDNNGTTKLEGSYTSSTATYSRPDLAPGTYYLRIRNFYNYEFSPYALKTSFVAVGTDAEPNGTQATASTLPLNATSNYCVGYLYNGVRDTNDWHKVILPHDGKLSITLTGNIYNTYLEVYAENGTTNLYSQYTTAGTLNWTKDNAAGTYYVKVKQFYTQYYSTYQLTAAHTTNNNNDGEPNKYAKQGALICGYATKAGNIGYTSGTGTVDNTDWFKLGYYTGAPLVINIAKVARTWDGNGNADVKYYLYKDTTAAPVDTAVMNGATGYTKSYAALTNGAYYIKMLRTAGYGGYTINAQYKDTCSHTVALVKSAGGSLCSKGSLTYYITRGRAPYSVQLYKDGAVYGAAVSTSDTARYTLLPPGNYYCRVKGNGAITYYVQSSSKAISPKPQATNATGITKNQATITWTSLACVDGYIVSYKKSTDVTFKNDTLPAGSIADTLKSLAASTIYNYKVQSFHKVGNSYYKGSFSTLKSFTTLAAREGEYTAMVINDNRLNIYPNPATSVLNLDINSDEVLTATITNSLGQTIKAIQIYANGTLSIDIADLKSGIYSLQLSNGNQLQSATFIKE
ncbi:MAG TPA: T9SS type A sorting domain-containing protein [Bacteroidia bacterium]|nr:T9SS type A sorting domain-containing protein [Bacteroidia bacterium]